MELNQQQQQAFDILTNYVYNDNNDEYDFMVLEGFAGTGKTVTINRIIEDVAETDSGQGLPDLFSDAKSTSSYAVGMTATTNKAVRVLKSFSEFKDKVEFGTLHSFCGLKQDINVKTGKISYVADGKSRPDKPLPIELIDVLIVDESSMLNSDLFGILYKFWERYKFKVIFVGDAEQLPPVGELMAIPFMPDMQRKYKIGVVRLNEIVRQAKGNQIIEYATNVRTNQPIVKNSNDNINFIPAKYEEVVAVLKQYFVTDTFKQNADYVKVLAFQNDTVDKFNTIIRELVYGKKGLPKILEGDCLIADKPIMTFMGRWQVKIPTNEELKVLRILDEHRPYPMKYEVYDKMSCKWNKMEVQLETYQAMVSYTAQDGRQTQHVIDVLREEFETSFNQVLNTVKESALSQKESGIRRSLWVQFYELQNHFAFVKYNYAITIHKSQGSSYDYALIHEWDINRNRKEEERRKLLYVAATRARNKLYIVNV